MTVSNETLEFGATLLENVDAEDASAQKFPALFFCVLSLQPVGEADIQGGRAGSLQDPQRRHGEECVRGGLRKHPHLPQQGVVSADSACMLKGYHSFLSLFFFFFGQPLTDIFLTPSAANGFAGCAFWGGACGRREHEANGTQPEWHGGGLAPQPPDCNPQLCEWDFLCSAAPLWRRCLTAFA